MNLVGYGLSLLILSRKYAPHSDTFLLLFSASNLTLNFRFFVLFHKTFSFEKRKFFML
jgi:hypothetical protein